MGKGRNPTPRAGLAALGLIAVLILLSAPALAAGAADLGKAPNINARAAILIDAANGTILYAKNPDLALPPASLAKLVTLHVAYQEIAAGKLSMDEIVEIDKHDASPYIPYGSSIMYLRAGMKVTVRDLMLGAAIISGNDAAYALARRISGSREAFAERMNAEVQALGFDGLVFTEPSGLSEKSLVSARQFAQFCRQYIILHPQAIGELHSVKSMEFPRMEHAVPGFVPQPRTIQYNRNPLIFGYPGADGLKTGYIIEVGFNMTATALRDGTRFIAVTLGGTGSSYAGGGLQRTRDTKALLDWAFSNFVTAAPDPGPIPEPRVWFGGAKRVKLLPAGIPGVTLPKVDAPGATVKYLVQSSLDAPLAKGTKAGRLIYYLNGKEVASLDLVTETGVARAGWFKRFFDGIGRFFFKLFARRQIQSPAKPSTKAPQSSPPPPRAP